MASDVLSALVLPPSRDPGTPCLTYLDPRTGERTELSGRAVGLWVSKTANFVVDELGLQAGDVLALRLPAHWQAWTWLLGAWLAGCVVDVAPAGSSAPADAEAAVVVASGLGVGEPDAGPAATLVSLALRPMALPGPPPPAGVLDFDTEVRSHGDRWSPRGAAALGRLRASDAGPGGERTDGAAGGPVGLPVSTAWPTFVTAWPEFVTASPAPEDGPGRRLLTTLAPTSAAATAQVVHALAAGSSIVLLGARPAPGGAALLAGEGVTHATSECRDLLT